jgi:tol-pal system protein YbgF
MEETFNDAKNNYTAGDLGKAEAGFKAFLSAYPNDRLADDARFYLGEVYFDRKEYSRAMSEYEGVVKEHPLADRVPDALYKAGIVNVQLKDAAKARDFFMRVMDNYPYSEAAKKARQSLDNLK